MKVGDAVLVLVDLGDKTKLGGNVTAGTVGTLMVIEDDYYEVAFDEDRLYTVKRDAFRFATPEQIAAGWVDLDNDTSPPDSLATDYDKVNESPF